MNLELPNTAALDLADSKFRQLESAITSYLSSRDSANRHRLEARGQLLEATRCDANASSAMKRIIQALPGVVGSECVAALACLAKNDLHPGGVPLKESESGESAQDDEVDYDTPILADDISGIDLAAPDSNC